MVRKNNYFLANYQVFKYFALILNSMNSFYMVRVLCYKSPFMVHNVYYTHQQQQQKHVLHSPIS